MWRGGVVGVGFVCVYVCVCGMHVCRVCVVCMYVVYVCMQYVNGMFLWCV